MTSTNDSSIIEAQKKLNQLGYEIPESELGYLGDKTKEALSSFQEVNGLAPSGNIDDHTWIELSTSSFNLGDRLLYERQPMFRGDDVTELQHRLNSLGFDAGREDGFFRAETAQALREFQRNVGLSSDGICGPNTVIALGRVSTFAESSATNLREEIKWKYRNSLSNYRVGIYIDPTFTLIGDRLTKALFEKGIKIPLYYEDGFELDIATEANENDIDFLFSISSSFAATTRCVFFSTNRYRSILGASLAGAIQHELANEIKCDPDDVVGRQYKLLQASKMPSVVIELCDTTDISMVRQINEKSDAIAKSIANGISSVITADEIVLT